MEENMEFLPLTSWFFVVGINGTFEEFVITFKTNTKTKNKAHNKSLSDKWYIC